MTGIIRKQTGGLLDTSHTLKWVTVEKYWSFIGEEIKKTLENRTESLLKGSLPSKEHSASSVEWVQLQSIRTWLKKKKGSQKIHTVLSVPNNLERKGREREIVWARDKGGLKHEDQECGGGVNIEKHSFWSHYWSHYWTYFQSNQIEILWSAYYIGAGKSSLLSNWLDQWQKVFKITFLLRQQLSGTRGKSLPAWYNLHWKPSASVQRL